MRCEAPSRPQPTQGLSEGVPPDTPRRCGCSRSEVKALFEAQEMQQRNALAELEQDA